MQCMVNNQLERGVDEVVAHYMLLAFIWWVWEIQWKIWIRKVGLQLIFRLDTLPVQN